MESRITLFILFCVASLASAGFTEEAAAEKTVSIGSTVEMAVPSFPYVAEITGYDVHIRCGPGTNYYSCGKLNKADRVKVVGSKHSWSQIVPPTGSFSWISKRYVKIEADNPTIGIVTGNVVRVRAGSADGNPLHSTTSHARLDKGDRVKLMGQEKNDYYKIAPPDGAYLWVLTQYTKPVPAGEVLPSVEPKTEKKLDTPAVVPTNLSVESEKLKAYYALQEQIKAERAKPINEQDYSNIKKVLVEIANNKAAGKASHYSEFAVKRIECFELALQVVRTVRLQDAQLQQIQQRIEKARATRLAAVQDLGRFAAVGLFQTSRIYGFDAEPKRYQVIDDSGKIVCFALPRGSASKLNLSKVIGRKVGLVGTIEPHPETATALVRFAEIVELK